MDFPVLERLLNTYGIPLAMLIAFGVLVGRGTLRWGPGIDASITRIREDWQARLDLERADRAAETVFREQLRIEERAGRLEAEQRLDEALEVARQAADLSASYERLVREKVIGQ